MATLSKCKLPFPEFDAKECLARRETEQDKSFDALVTRSRSLPKGEVVGAVIALPMADSAAYYVVTKAAPLTVAHIPYMDAWHVHPATLRGLRKADILSMKY